MLCLLRRLWVTCMMLCITIFCVHAQHVVTGTVKDVAGEPVIGANILVKGTTNNGTITDIDGNFSLEAPTRGVLEVSFIGYVKQEVSIGGNKHINIILVEDATTLDDVVVIGYGTTKKSDLTASVASVKGDVIAASASTSITDALQGKVPGHGYSGITL